MPLAIDVLLPLPVAPLTYLPPLRDVGEGELRPGQRIVVPWQAGVRIGLVAERRMVDAGRGLGLRHALHGLEEQAWLEAPALATVMHLARYSGVPAGLVLATLNPPGLQQELRHELRLLPGALGFLAALGVPRPDGVEDGGAGWVAAAAVPAKALEELRKQGLVDERTLPVLPTKRVLAPSRPPDDDLEGARRLPQRIALERLFDLGEAASAAALAVEAGVSASAVRALIAKGYAEYAAVPADDPPLLAAPAETPLPEPTAEDVPPEGDGAVVGGTRLERLAAVLPRLRADLAAGGGVLVLAPETAMAAEAAAALGASLPTALLTGEASDRQRLRLWSDLHGPRPQVVVGTYLALLAPLTPLRRVVLVDAASSAYKLQSGSRTLVSKAARVLAKAAGAALTLLDVMVGPELVTLVPPGARRQLPLPKLRLHVADLSEGDWPVHADLTRTLRQVVERERQAVILAPRRGYSGSLGCQQCGWQAPCPNCDLTLRYHRDEAVLRCHQCGHEEAPPQRCPACGSGSMGPLRGAGTQWVASQLRSALGGFPVYRFDKDQRDDVGPLLAGAPGVVVGTLAVLGLPTLPELSLIGVTHFDTHLAASDFRAEEEVTRTLLRLAELSGRRRALLVVQTHSPRHELLAALGAEEPAAALEVQLGRQLARRKRFGYPPFASLAKLQLSARDRGSALAAAQHAADALLTGGALPEEVLGPASAPVERLKGRYIFQLLLRATDDVRLEQLLANTPQRYDAAKLTVDVDPRDVGAFLE